MTGTEICRETFFATNLASAKSEFFKDQANPVSPNSLDFKDSLNKGSLNKDKAVKARNGSNAFIYRSRRNFHGVFLEV